MVVVSVNAELNLVSCFDFEGRKSREYCVPYAFEYWSEFYTIYVKMINRHKEIYTV